jgi:hypothetical protein
MGISKAAGGPDELLSNTCLIAGSPPASIRPASVDPKWPPNSPYWAGRRIANRRTKRSRELGSPVRWTRPLAIASRVFTAGLRPALQAAAALSLAGVLTALAVKPAAPAAARAVPDTPATPQVTEASQAP